MAGNRAARPGLSAGVDKHLPTPAARHADSPRDVPGKFCGGAYPYLDREGVSYGHGHGLTL